MTSTTDFSIYEIQAMGKAGFTFLGRGQNTLRFVAPRVTHLVTPPPTAIVEHRPDGGLLMAATDKTFDVGNPAHMSVARDIECAVAPLNSRPWEPENPKSSIISRSQ